MLGPASLPAKKGDTPICLHKLWPPFLLDVLRQCQPSTRHGSGCFLSLQAGLPTVTAASSELLKPSVLSASARELTELCFIAQTFSRHF